MSDTIFEKIREGCQRCDYESKQKYAYQDKRNLRVKAVYKRKYTFNYPSIQICMISESLKESETCFTIVWLHTVSPDWV